MRPAVRFRLSALPSCSMAGSGTDEGLTVDSQLRLFNKKLTETYHPFRISPYDPFPRTLALIMLTRLETLLCNWSLLMRAGLCPPFPDESQTSSSATWVKA